MVQGDSNSNPVPEVNPELGQDDEPLTVEQAIANLQGDHLGLRVYAAWWLGRFRVAEPRAIDVLIAALADEDDRTSAGGYPLRRNAARALGKLGDRRAVSPLIECLSCVDFYVREAAAQSLGMLGDPSCIPALIALLTAPAPEAAASAALLPQPYDSILEALGALQAREAIPAVEPFLDHATERVQYAAARAMYQLADDPEVAQRYGDRLIAALSHPNLQLRRTVLMDLGAIAYLPAAQPIANALAENSLKLIALRGILEQQVVEPTELHELSDGAIAVMELMDTLL